MEIAVGGAIINGKLANKPPKIQPSPHIVA